MNIVVLNGSPKGDLSVTMQSVRFIETHAKDHTFEYIHVSQNIKALAGKQEKRDAVVKQIEEADAILIGTPVYTFTVPSQLKHFIELMFDKKNASVFDGKPTGVITTSINFFDHTAHNYLRAICDDLKVRFYGAFSADSYDLLDEMERQRLLGFADQFFKAIENDWVKPRIYPPMPPAPPVYIPSSGSSPQTHGKKIVVVTDQRGDTPSQAAMVEQLCASFDPRPEVVNLNEIRIAGGCVGCVQCGFDHECIYAGKDDLITMYEEKIKTADIVFMAGTIRDRYLSYKWKEFFDRGFYNNHTPTLTGKQMAYLVSGPLSQAADLRQVLNAFTEWQGANLVDIVTDEAGDPKAIDRAIAILAAQALSMAEVGYVKPSTFLGKAGMKVFRDDVFGRHRFVFQKDHDYFEAHGIYDFPQDDKRAMDTNAFMFDVMKDPNTKEAIRKMLKTEMVKPHKKVVSSAK